MIIVIASFLKHRGMALFPFILLKHSSFKTDRVLINHERIHLRQQLELLIVPFYIIYGIHYLVNLMKTRNHASAYRLIVFEKEAYANESELEYLSKRKMFAFLKYF